MIPKNAILEKVLDFSNGDLGIAIYDVSELLRFHSSKLATKAIKDKKPRKARYEYRDPSKIDTVILHKSGANGPNGYEGCLTTTEFVVYHRGWDGPAYTFWIPRYSDLDNDGRQVIYRMNSDNVKSWHTGGKLNEVGIGIAIQGNYDGQWDLLSNGLPRIDKKPTQFQYVALDLLLDYISDKYSITYKKRSDGTYNLTGHWEHGKLCCPGDAIRSYVMSRRGEIVMIGNETPIPIPIEEENNLDIYRLTPTEFQKVLYVLDYYHGKITGSIDETVRLALEEFQLDNFLKVDGWFGFNTARTMRTELIRQGLLNRHNFDTEFETKQQKQKE